MDYTTNMFAAENLKNSTSGRSGRGCMLPFQLDYKGVIHIISLPIILFGVLSNILSVMIFVRKTKRTSTTICLIMLSIVDGFHCLFFLPYALGIYPYTGALPAIYKYGGLIKMVSQPLVNLFKTVSVYLLGLLSLERLLAVAAPTKFPTWFAMKRMSVYIIALVLAAIALISAQVVFRSYTIQYDVCLKDIRYRTMFRGGRGSFFTQHYLGHIQPIFAYGVPLVVILVCNIWSFVLMKIRRNLFSLKTTAVDRSFNRMVAVVVGMSTICFLPNVILPFVLSSLKSRKTLLSLVATRHFFGLLNSAANILVYFSLGPKFRLALLGYFNKCLKRMTPTSKTFRFRDTMELSRTTGSESRTESRQTAVMDLEVSQETKCSLR